MYVTKAQLIDRFGAEELERYAWLTDADSVDDDKIDQAITDASETVDLYIGAIVGLPIANPPAILTSLAADIARYRLQDDSPLDVARERYEAAMARLKDIAQGKATLNLGDAEASAGAAPYVERGVDDRLFTRETLADF